MADRLLLSVLVIVALLSSYCSYNPNAKITTNTSSNATSKIPASTEMPEQSDSEERIQPVKSSPDSIRLNLTLKEWASTYYTYIKGEDNWKSTSYTINVDEGEQFGVYCSSCRDQLFRLDRILNENRIVVSFDQDFVVQGESINKPSEKNPTYITAQKTCFHRRRIDYSQIICLNIIG